ncbi:hypothetical protein [Mangrovibacterium marinum]|uniref:Ricin-type beta-trefoil lectin protein n=1 Tax=Mangrovibacterium marinum TaxID=1639118 RepID=A0A2T5BZI3_9BACT|nr:hypothetical protein [Mangrovibacterium marinum]PTN07693.1 hypothetical protein C8N47_11436 [Mangrovibacterium marinum]
MKRFVVLIGLMVLGLVGSAQMKTIVTSLADEALNKVKPFVLVDQATGYVMAQKPVKYNSEADMPECYFTTLPVSEIGLTVCNASRILAINTRVNSDAFAINLNQDEKEIFFSPRKYLATAKWSYLWEPRVEGNWVCFRNVLQQDVYLAVDNSGNYQKADAAHASRWQLIWSGEHN